MCTRMKIATLLSISLLFVGNASLCFANQSKAQNPSIRKPVQLTTPKIRDLRGNLVSWNESWGKSWNESWGKAGTVGRIGFFRDSINPGTLHIRYETRAGGKLLGISSALYDTKHKRMGIDFFSVDRAIRPLAAKRAAKKAGTDVRSPNNESWSDGIRKHSEIRRFPDGTRVSVPLGGEGPATVLKPGKPLPGYPQAKKAADIARKAHSEAYRAMEEMMQEVR